MKTALFVVFVALVGYTAAQTCADTSAPSAKTLSFCTMYNTASCCSATVDEELGRNFTARIAPIYGTANCAANLKNLLCAVACAPDQLAYIVPNPIGGRLSVTVYLDAAVATGIYESCKGRCVHGGSFAPTMTAEQLFGAAIPASFLSGLSSSSDPTYPANLPLFTYVVGNSPLSSMNYSIAALGQSAADSYGCTGVPRCFGTPGAPAARSLTFCTEYASSGCCSEQIENDLRANFTKVAAVLGTNGCADNIRKLFCSWTCSPNQYDFISYMRGYQNIKAVLNVTVSPAFTTGMFNSCKNHCFDDRTGSPATVEQKFAVGAPYSILAFLSSSSDPSYQANADSLPIVTYMAGAGFDTTVSAASGADLTGCPATPSTDGSTTGAAGSLVFPLVALFFAASLLLALF